MTLFIVIITFKATVSFEEDRGGRDEAARDKRHRAALNVLQSMDHRCDTCGRLCASSFGLRSHMRSHRWEYRRRHRRHSTDYQDYTVELLLFFISDRTLLFYFNCYVLCVNKVHMQCLEVFVKVGKVWTIIVISRGGIHTDPPCTVAR
jgi:hypothetical protein